MKTIAIFYTFLLVASSAFSQTPNTWTQKADFGGTARYGAVGFSIGSKGYLGTGYNSVTNYKDFWEYDPSLNTWTQKADFGGTARQHAVGFSIGSKGYLGTGFDISGSYYKDFWEYDPDANTWTQKADFGGTACYSAVGFSIGNKGYLGTGYDINGNYKKDFWEYDPDANTWTQKADFGGTARNTAVGFSIGSKGYLGTGYNSGAYKKDFWEYDPDANTWTQKADFGGTARYYAVGFSIGSKGYLGTGYGSAYYKDFWEYDPDTNTWTQKADFGGTARSQAVAFSIGNQGYIGTGYVNAPPYKFTDFWEYTPDVIVPTSQAPWDKRFGGSGSDFLLSLQQTTDGGYILGGHSSSGFGGDKTQGSQGLDDYWIVKTDANGVKQWDKRFGGSGLDYFYPLQQTTDGGYILGGSSSSGISGDKTQGSQGSYDYWIVKISANGMKQWDARFGGSNSEWLVSLQQTTDGGYILGGYSSSPISGDKTQGSQGSDDYWIVKISANGMKQWDACFGGSDYDWLYSLDQTTDGGYILGGFSSSGISGDKTQGSQGSYDYWIVKTDASGVKQWDARFGGSDSEALFSLQQTTDGGYILGGRSSSPISGDKTQGSQGFDDYWIVKTDASGVKQWDARFGGSDSEGLLSLQQTTDGGYILGGYSWSGISGDKTQGSQGFDDYWIVKTDASGVKQWDKRFGGSKEDELRSLQQTTDGGYILGGMSFSGMSGDKTQASQGSRDYWIVKVACAGFAVYADADDDTYGNINNSYFASDCIIPPGYVIDNTDCNDASASINPAAAPVKQFDLRYGGNSNDKLNGLQQTTDGGYILGGGSRSPVSGDKSQANWDATNATLDYWLVKTNAGGTKLWDKRFGGTADDGMNAMQQTSDGGYILGGYSYSAVSGDKTQANWDATGATPDYWLVKTDAGGTLQWNYRFGGTAYDELLSTQQTSDGGYILAGYSASGATGDRSQASQGANDYWIIKLNSSGVKQWDKSFGGTGNDYLFTARQTSDGGYILGGRSQSGVSGDKTQSNWDPSNTTYDYWIIKTDASGNKVWDKRFGGSGDEFLYSLKQTWDGGYILGGYSNSAISGDKTQASQGSNDYWIVKITSDGTKQWDMRYGGSGDDQLFTLLQTPEGGYLLGGSSASGISGDKTQVGQGLKDYWIVKTSETGIKQWDARYGGSKNDFMSVLQQTADGGYVLGGYSFSGITGDKTQANWDAAFLSQDYWMVKLSVNTGYEAFYPDTDNDGYGNPFVIRFACSAPAGYVSVNTDCNDVSGTIHPGASDLCNSIDDNCNGVIDENTITATVTPAGSVSICSGVSLTLTANSGAGITYQWKKGSKEIAGATNATYSTTKAGSYKVIENNSFSCSSTSATTTITVATNPTATITPLGNLDICVTGSVELQANEGGGLTYQWKKGSNNVTGATNQNYTATKAATYKVVVTNSSGCSKTSSGTKVTKSCKDGLSNNKISAGELFVYPNPTTGNISVEYTGSAGAVQFTIYDVMGKVVFTQEEKASEGTIDTYQFHLTDLSPGTYVLEARNGVDVRCTQFVIER